MPALVLSFLNDHNFNTVMLALPSVFVSGSYKYGWTPSSSLPSLSLLEILLLFRKNPFLQIR